MLNRLPRAARVEGVGSARTGCPRGTQETTTRDDHARRSRETTTRDDTRDDMTDDMRDDHEYE